jgi:hypothetical protein
MHRMLKVITAADQEARIYQPKPISDEWKAAPTAILYKNPADNLGSEVKSSNNETISFQSHSIDGNGLDTQTGFRPRLFLKCGPLVRFSGISKELTAEESGNHGIDRREMWRGSIMIVTDDSESSYEPPPKLWLSRQLVNTQEALDRNKHTMPETMDPITGQIKLSRTGTELYVKPLQTLPECKDLSCIEDDRGLFQKTATVASFSAITNNEEVIASNIAPRLRPDDRDNNLRQDCIISGTRLHAAEGVTFWRFKFEIELCSDEARILYRINGAPAIDFWVPARGQIMNIMFHSCNGFSLAANPDLYAGPDPMWRDVLNTHQERPFHVMIGGGDQIYNDKCMKQTLYFKKWLGTKTPFRKSSASFATEMQDELESFYLKNYMEWFSQGMFGMANSRIPMVNIWDDHDIIDGYGSYPQHLQLCPVFSGLGAVAFKYYLLFQHQSLVDETEREEQSWLLGAKAGPYINQLSRSIFVFLGRGVAFLGVDCRTERTVDQILSAKSWDLIFDRCKSEITGGDTKHLIVLLGVVR